MRQNYRKKTPHVLQFACLSEREKREKKAQGKKQSVCVPITTQSDCETVGYGRPLQLWVGMILVLTLRPQQSHSQVAGYICAGFPCVHKYNEQRWSDD